jgi:hypothetical protein
VKKYISSGFSLNFQVFSVIRHLLMAVFPFMFYHPLESVEPCFKDKYERFLSNFGGNVGDGAFSALPVRSVVFGDLSLDITNEEEVTWCEVPAVGRVRYPLDRFCEKTFSGSPGIMQTCVAQAEI